jgi:hypothetical protein
MGASRYAPIAIQNGSKVGTWAPSRSAPFSFKGAASPGPRRDAQGRFISASARASGAFAHIVGLPELQKALEALAKMGADAKTALIGTDLTDPPYPFFLEYGTSKMPAFPAARPAWDEMGEPAQKAIADYVGQLIAQGSRDGDRVFTVALQEGARLIEDRWKELARFRTGTYRRSIHTTISDVLVL